MIPEAAAPLEHRPPPAAPITEPTAPPGDSASHPAVRDFIIDFKTSWRRAFLPLLLTFGVIASIGPIVVAAKNAGLTQLSGAVGGGIVGGVAGIASMMFLMRTLGYRARRDFLAALAGAAPPHATDQILAALRVAGERYGHTGMGHASDRGINAVAAKALAIAPDVGSGRVFRVAPFAEALPPIQAPFETTFEPTPINVARQSFAELFGRKLTTRDHLNAARKVTLAALGRRKWLRMLVITLMCIGYAVLGLMLLDSLRQLLLGRFSQGLYIGAILIIGFTSAVLWQQFRSDNWFAVPSGLIVLRGSWRSTKVTARLLTRDDSALLFVAPMQHVTIAARDGFVAQRRLSPFEFELLLRAWLSPVPPPSPKIVEAFAETSD